MKHLTPRQHFWEYARKSLTICAVCYAAPCLIALFGMGCQGMFWLTLGLLGLFCLTWGILLLRGAVFLMGIRRQEKQGLAFETGPLQWLGTSYTSTWLSPNWLIHAGHVALHRSQIASVTLRRSNNTSIFRTCSYEMMVTDCHGRRYHWPLSRAAVQRVMDWHAGCLPS